MGGKGNPAAESLSKFTNTLEREGRSSRQTYMKQGFEALNTGGRGAQIPIMQRALADQQRAFGDAMKQSQGFITRTGGAGDNVLGQGVVQQRYAGDQTINRYPVEYAAQMGEQAQQYAYGAPPIAAKGLAQAAQAKASSDAADTSATIGGASAAMSALIGLVSLCWVAEVLYGLNHPKTHAARRYALSHDTWFTRLYKKRGRRWAAILISYPWLKPVVRPIWDYMAYQGSLTPRTSFSAGLGFGHGK
jgi:hypothetical protein